jgi:hypothetical protein
MPIAPHLTDTPALGNPFLYESRVVGVHEGKSIESWMGKAIEKDWRKAERTATYCTCARNLGTKYPVKASTQVPQDEKDRRWHRRVAEWHP